MIQYGNATHWGVDGTGKLNGSGTALDAFVEAIDGDSRAQIEEFLDGFGELIGFRKRDERLFLNLTLVPKKVAAAGSLAAATAALKYFPIPSRFSLSGFPDNAAFDLWGDLTNAVNADYIYVGGQTRTMARTQAATRITIFRPTSSALTVAQLLTVAT